jgi:hypothetical protein
VSWWPRKCPVCRLELPERGNSRRYVPWRRGFRLVHAGACAAAIDAQGVLELDRQPDRVDVVTLVRVRRLAQLLGRENERGELARQPLERVTALMRRLANLEQPFVGGPLGDRRQRPLLRHNELVDHMRQLAHQPKACAPARTEARVP